MRRAVLVPNDKMFLLHLSLGKAAQALVCVNLGSTEMLSLKEVSVRYLLVMPSVVWH